MIHEGKSAIKINISINQSINHSDNRGINKSNYLSSNAFLVFQIGINRSAH